MPYWPPSSGTTTDPELSLDGHGLLFDKDRQAAHFLRRFQPLDDLIAQIDESIQRQSYKDSPVGESDIGLPRPNYPKIPPPRINQLYWPSGAARWARGYFLASSTVAAALGTKCGTALPFIARINDLKVETQLYCLPPRPVSAVDQAEYEALFIIPVVDLRYWWQFRNFGDKGKPDVTTWADLIAHLGTRLGVTIAFDAINAAYLKPDPDEFTRRYDNAATMLDAVAHSIGQRIVRQLNGDIRSISWQQSMAESDKNYAQRTPWWQIAGDDFSNKPIPATVTVIYPRVNCGMPTCNREVFTVSVGNQTQKCSVQGSAHTIHSTAWANFSLANSVHPTNETELEQLAFLIGVDFYRSLERCHDRTFDGIKDLYFTGFEDHVLYSFGTEDTEAVLEASTKIEKLGDDEFKADTKLTCRYEGGYFTRVTTAPLNFGVDSMLQQGSINPRVPAGVLPMSLKPGQFLHPGSSALAYFMTWSGQSWEVDTSQCENLVYDPHYRNCFVGKERFYARRSCENGRLEIVGENGLHRMGLIRGPIQSNGTGPVEIITGPMNVFGFPTCDPSESGQVVEACNPGDAASLGIGTICYLDYHPDHFKWFVDPFSSGKLIRFEMKSQMNLGGQATAIEVGSGPTFTPIGAIFPIKDPWTIPGMWRYDPKTSNVQARGYMGWCVIPTNATIEQGVPVREIVWMEQIARSIDFTLMADMSGGQALASIDTYSMQGKDPAQSDLAEQVPNALMVYDTQGNYPHALEDAKGKARYNDRTHRYEVIECNQMATALACILSKMCPDDESQDVSAFSPMTFAQYGQKPRGPITAINSYSLATEGGAGLLLWNESFEQWEITQVEHVTRFLVKSAALSKSNCNINLAVVGEYIAVMTCGDEDNANSAIQLSQMNLVKNWSIHHTPGSTSGSGDPIPGVCNVNVTFTPVCVLQPDEPTDEIISHELTSKLVVEDVFCEGLCIKQQIYIGHFICADESEVVEACCGIDCDSSSTGGQ